MGKDPNAKSLHDALDAAVMKADRLASQQRDSARSSTPTYPSQVLHRRFELAKTTHLIRRIRSLLSRQPPPSRKRKRKRKRTSVTLILALMLIPLTTGTTTPLTTPLTTLPTRVAVGVVVVVRRMGGGGGRVRRQLFAGCSRGQTRCTIWNRPRLCSTRRPRTKSQSFSMLSRRRLGSSTGRLPTRRPSTWAAWRL